MEYYKTEKIEIKTIVFIDSQYELLLDEGIWD